MITWTSFLISSSWLAAQSQPEDSLPAITSIRRAGSNLVVTASIPAGNRKVTLESRERLRAGAWVPRAVARLDGSDGVEIVQFRLAVTPGLEFLRIRAEATEALPASFYGGTNQFGGEPTGSAGPGTSSPTAGPTDATMTAGSESAAPDREVVESDLWNIQGDTLYFFNQYRGLQVIDVSQPDQPQVRGLLDLPAAGEQMYVLSSGQVLLLAQGGCYFNNNDESQILVVQSVGDQPEIVARLDVPGRIQESRMVGSALYVASQTYRVLNTADGTIWEWGLAVSSYDFSDPTTPVARDTLWFSGYGNVIAATERYFFVVTQNPSDWRRSVVNIVDISDPLGSMELRPGVKAAGQVQDKFKMNERNDVFTVISQVQTTNLFTRLETFSLVDPAQPKKLGELSLGLSERLHATRFVEDRVYVVTFFTPYRIDPLSVVDLSHPERPEVVGELEIPGFSTFLYPRGNQLIALGLETNRTTVSLFDVVDPAHPSLLSRVQVGDGWSWTEANSNEKAFNVLEEEGLILLPYQSWTTAGYVQRVQLIDLLDDSLRTRGAIDHSFSPRRATLHGNRILSLSGRELLSVDATDRDAPRITATTELAWPVDRVLLHGDYLIEVEAGGFWGVDSPPVLRVTRAASPNTILSELVLTNLPVNGLTIRQNHLYVAQGQSGYYPVPLLTEDAGSQETADAVTNFFLTVVDLQGLPELRISGVTAAAVKGFGGSQWDAVWPQEDLLVWGGGGWSYGWWPWDVAVPMMAGMAVADTALFWPPWFWGGGGQLLAFNVKDSSAPRLVSELDLGTNGWWNFSKPFSEKGLVYLSHQASQFVEDMEVSGLTTTDGTKSGTWIQRYYLDVIDYADPSLPTPRTAVNIPGQLQGLSHQGALLYTKGYHFDPVDGHSDWTEYLDASAYDGVSAYLVDSHALPAVWPHPLLVDQDNIFLGAPGTDYYSTNAEPNYLEVWTLTDQGRFARLNQVRLPNPASQLDAYGDLLAVRETENSLLLFDASRPEDPRIVGQGRPTGCLWFDLDRADGDLSRGLWLALGPYGVTLIPASR